MKPAPGQRDLFGGGQSALPQYDAAREADVCRCFVVTTTERCPVHDAIPLNSTVAPEDVPRLSNNTQAVLARLRRGPATGPELLSPDIGGIGFKQRVHELRRAGYAITTTHVKDGVHEYRLIDRGEGDPR